jgi:siroheme synthase
MIVLGTGRSRREALLVLHAAARPPTLQRRDQSQNQPASCAIMAPGYHRPSSASSGKTRPERALYARRDDDTEARWTSVACWARALAIPSWSRRARCVGCARPTSCSTTRSSHPDLLRHLKPSAEIVFVGKRAGRVERAPGQHQRTADQRGRAAGKQVVRLKGGDPYLFGRGSEEAEALAAAGIPFEVVPGVPRPWRPAYTGISLTHRDLASSVAYVTATESVEKDESAHDWTKLATATQTLVFFMGLRKLDTLMSADPSRARPSSPAAVVSCASLPSQRTVVGTVEHRRRRCAHSNRPCPR